MSYGFDTKAEGKGFIPVDEDKMFPQIQGYLNVTAADATFARVSEIFYTELNSPFNTYNIANSYLGRFNGDRVNGFIDSLCRYIKGYGRLETSEINVLVSRITSRHIGCIMLKERVRSQLSKWSSMGRLRNHTVHFRNCLRLVTIYRLLRKKSQSVSDIKTV